MISSNSNKVIKYISNLLKKSSFRKDQLLYVAEGEKIFKEINKEDIDSLYFSENYYNSLTKEELINVKSYKYEIISDKIFNSLSDTKTPQGILAICKQKKYNIKDINFSKNISIIILENLQDPGNLGTIFRSAEAANVELILLNKSSVDVYSPKVVRSAMGAIARVKHIYVDDLKESIIYLKEKKVNIYAAHLKAINYYDKVDYKNKVAFMIGNESKGLSNDIASLADEYIKIPLYNKAESLNAGVAASILMYEYERQNRDG